MKKWMLKKLRRDTPEDNGDEKGLALRDTELDGLPRYKSNWHLHNLIRAASGKGAGAGMSREAILSSCERIERENPGVYTETIAFIHRILDRRDEVMEIPVTLIIPKGCLTEDWGCEAEDWRQPPHTLQGS